MICITRRRQRPRGRPDARPQLILRVHSVPPARGRAPHKLPPSPLALAATLPYAQLVAGTCTEEEMVNTGRGSEPPCATTTIPALWEASRPAEEKRLRRAESTGSPGHSPGAARHRRAGGRTRRWRRSNARTGRRLGIDVPRIRAADLRAGVPQAQVQAAGRPQCAARWRSCRMARQRRSGSVAPIVG
jgi:hypothetical protein